MVVAFGEQTSHYFNRLHIGVPEAIPLGPAAWRPADMADTRHWMVHLTDDHVAELESAFFEAVNSGIAMADLVASQFPLPSLAGELATWRREVTDGRGFLVVRGFPVESWGVEQTEYIYWGLGLHLGQPGAQNPEGDLLGHVVDHGDAGDLDAVRVYRTSNVIRFHCDGADMVGLLCLTKSASGGRSQIVSSVSVFAELLASRPDLAARLCESFALDLRNDADEVKHLPVRPVCHDGRRVRTFFDSDCFRSAERHESVELGRLDIAALDAWEDIAMRPSMCLEMDLEPGDLQLLSNHTIAHARTAYEDVPDLPKRHLLRLWLTISTH